MLDNRLITAMATPMKADGAVDYHVTGRLARLLVERGSDGLVVAGSTGESGTLDVCERMQLLEVVLDQVGGEATVFANVGTNDTAASVDLVRQAERLGAHGAMAVVPYYNKPPQAGLILHFSRIADATSLPLMLYNVPGRTGINMTAETVLELARTPNIAAVKEASGNLDQVATIVAGAPAGFVVFSGDDGLALPIMAVGGRGLVSVASHLVGPELRSLIESFAAGDHGRALAIHQRLLPLFSALFAEANPIPLKGALELAGFPVGPPRLPLPPARAATLELLASIMSGLGLVD